MAKNCLIYETLNSVHDMQQEKTNDGFMHLKGVFGVCGVKNNNARIYEAGNYGKMVAEMKERLKAKPIPGELEHPQTMNITLDNISHKITDINIDENGVVSGEIVLLNTPKGKIAQAIVEGGLPLFISSRAQGSVNPNTSIVTLENLATYDLVGSPGFSQAELHLNEGQVAESICESCGYIYTPEEEKPAITEGNNNTDNNMEKELLERLEKLESTVQQLQEENEALRAQINEQETIDKKALCDGIQKWIIEEYSPEVQKWVVEEYSPEVQKWVTEEYAPESKQDILKRVAEGVQKWVVEEYSPEVQNWCFNEFAPGVQNWFINECAPTFESWVTEHYNEEVKNQITEAVDASKKNSLSNIENTLSLLENIQVSKPQYPGAKSATLITENNAPKYITEMPADVRVKYDLASEDIKEAIDRRAKLFDFSRHTINEFWSGVNFDNIKPIVNESLQSVTDERERAIRAQLMAWRANRK